MDQSPPTTNGHSNDTRRHSSPVLGDSAGPPTSRATSNFDSPQQRSNAIDDDNEARPPPAKRARKYSDADQASIANVSIFFVRSTGVLTPFFLSALKTGSPPPITASSVQTNGDTVASSPTPVPIHTGNGISTLSPVQHRFCLSTVRSLKKLKDAAAFVHPVDPVALNIPHYPTIIKTPMDLSTIERKLMASNPAKPETSPNIPRYYSAEEFVSDVRLVFSNCITFNGPDHVIAQAGKHVEAVFDKQIKQLPPPAEVCHLLMNAACPTHYCSRSLLLSRKLPHLHPHHRQLPPRKLRQHPFVVLQPQFLLFGAMRPNRHLHGRNVKFIHLLRKTYHMPMCRRRCARLRFQRTMAQGSSSNIVGGS
jgi:hypothetical protein